MKRLYYCKAEKDDEGGMYCVAHSRNKAKMMLWKSGWCDGEYIDLTVNVLPKFDTKIQKYPIGEFDDYKGIRMDISHWDDY